jgi:hypothetical protein
MARLGADILHQRPSARCEATMKRRQQRCHVVPDPLEVAGVPMLVGDIVESEPGNGTTGNRDPSLVDIQTLEDPPPPTRTPAPGRGQRV